MVNYQQNGQPYYGHQSHPSQPQYNQYASYGSQFPPPNHTLHSTASFDRGDDAAAHDGAQGYQSTGGNQQHIATSNAVAQNNNYPSSVSHQPLPLRTSSQTAGFQGHQQQYQVPATSQPTYNPQSFTSAQPLFTSPANYTPTQNYNYTSSFQPYIPAAYQPATSQRQTAYGAQSAYSAQAAYATPQAPPPPPRPHEQVYLGRQPSYSSNHPSDSASTYAPTPPSHPGSAPLPPLPSPYSSPAPPLPPRHDSFSHGHSNTARPRLEQSQHSSPSSFHSGMVHSPQEDSTNPPTYNNSDHRSFGSRMNSRANEYHSSPPAPTSVPTRLASHTSPQRTDSLSHPHQRPLPTLPTDSESDSDYFGLQNGTQTTSEQREELAYDDLMREVEAAVNQGRPTSSGTRTSPRASRSSRQTTIRDGDADSASTVTPIQSMLVPDEQPSHTNTTFTPTGSGSYINYGAFSEGSDAEASYGLAAMQADEERDAAEARRRSGSTSLFSSQGSQRQPRLPLPPMQDVSSDSDYGNVDMGLVGGGYEANMHYGDDLNVEAPAGPPPPSYTPGPRMDSIRSSDRSSGGRSSQASAYDGMPSQDAIHPFPPFKHHDVARVDTSGTGGLTEPSPHPRRMSFEDGDEATLVDHDFGQPSGSPSKDSMADLFFHPGMSPQRPLPPPPIDTTNRIAHLIPAGTYRHQQHDPMGRYGPDQFEHLRNDSAVPRSTSDVSTRRIIRTDQPIRAKTDADRAKALKQMSGSTSYDSSGAQSAVPVDLDLPALPRKKFNPKKLGLEQFKKCTEPWALGAILAWIKDLAQDETDLRQNAITEGIVALFVHKVPTMNTADAEALGDKVVKDMFAAGALITEEEWVKFGTETMSGVLFQLTGTGCYSSKLHVFETPGRCYSYHCMRTLKKVDLSQLLEPEKKQEDWMKFYKVSKEDAERRDKKELERQNILHEIVTSEDYYMSSLDVLRILYRDSLARTQPPIIPEKKMKDFMKEVYGQVDIVKKVNEDYLLAQLKYRQKEQGPWIVGFSDIFREWIRKAKSVYVDYAAAFPRADYLVRREAGKNLLFQQFLNQAREDKRSNRLGWDTYLKSPITRLQRYSLLLQTVHKQMLKESEEKTNLQFAIDEVRAATFECNAKLAEMEKKMALLELQNKLRLRKGMDVELNLNHLGREILYRGDLLRAGGKGLQWVETHAILFDNYLVLAKAVHQRDSAGSVKNEVYDVSKVPIPMDLIVIESTNEPAVVKSSLKGMGAITSSVGPRGPGGVDNRLARTTSTPTSVTSGPGTLTHRDTNSGLSERSSGKSMVTTTVLDTPDEKIMFPFKVKHLGRNESYILYAPTSANRQEWCEALITAKTEHAQALFEQNAEPFRLRVLADTAFGYDAFTSSHKTVVIKGTPLDRAIKETEKQFKDHSRPGPVCRASVNCATVFNQPYGRLMMAVGTDYGVFISEYSNSRGWQRSIQAAKVTQVYVFEEFNLFLVIADKSLIAYPLDIVCPVPGQTAPDSARRAPQKLSGSREVNFFATGRMKDRALVIYKKKEGMSSTFKVLEPILQKSTTSRSRFLPSSTRRGHTDFFRDYDEFYVPTECYGLNLFHSSLAVSTARGVEVLTLDKKQPHSVPNKYSDQPDAQAYLTSIHSRIADLKPLGMFRLSEAEFLVCYDECAVYVNRHGDVSRGVVMEFVGRARTACLYGQFLILLDDDFVEIRNAANGRLKQVIAGRDIKLLDDGGGGNTPSNGASGGGTGMNGSFPSAGGGMNGPISGSAAQLGGGVNGLGLKGYGAAPRTVKICMQHPEVERLLVVVELVENESRKDTLT